MGFKPKKGISYRGLEKAQYDKPQSRQSTPVRMPSRAGQFGKGGKGRRSIPRSK